MTGLVIDSFAGGGGASLGLEQAIGRPVDVAINHDRKAIGMHEANHPGTRHYHQDIWQVDPVEVVAGRNVELAWFSPDCTHFSKAKGGAPVKREIRDLAWVVIEWAKAVRPRVIMLENVEEFRTWGPLGPDNRPDPERKGETWREWLGQLRALGYEVEWRELRACDYGTPTIRKRLFVVARCDGLPIRWPAATHGAPAPMLPLLPYRTAAECIDWWRECPSIFERSKELAPATMRRIANGMRRYVFEAKKPFIVRTGHYSHRSGEGFGFRGQGPDEPLATVTSVNDFGIVTPYLAGVGGRAGQSPERSVDSPLRTITSKGDEALVVPYMWRQTENGDGYPATQPLGTVVASGVTQSIVAPVIVRQNHDGQGKAADSLEEPLRTVTTQHNKHALVAAFLAKHFGDRGQRPGSEMREPMGTVTAVDHHALVTSNLLKLYGTNDGASMAAPLPTVTAGGNHLAEVRALLVGYYGNERDGQPVDVPMRTVTSKERYGLVYVYGEPYEVVDIGMRMLWPRELYRAQGFPEGYVIDPVVDGRRLTKTDQVRMCGNSVCPQMSRALAEANVGTLGQQAMWRGYELAAAGGAG